MIKYITSLLAMICYTTITAQNSISIVGTKLTATFQHISCHVNISGDENHNSEMLIQYRIKGSNVYKEGASTIRANPDLNIDGSALNMNFHAGSAMFLNPDTNYEIKMIITDPDGGDVVIEKEIKTKAFPQIFGNRDTVNVSIASGTNAIQSAINFAHKGDLILVDDGIYEAFIVTKDSIFLKSKNLHGAIIDGSNTERGIVTLSSNDSSRHQFIDGFVIRNGRWGIDAQNTQFLTVQNCLIYDVDYGIVNRRENGWEHDQYFTNNKIQGRTSWPQRNGNIPSERGIDIRGNNNVVSFNTISDFGDGISTDGAPYKQSYSLDIHHNDINRIVDDLIEVDGMVSNSRVYANRAWNGRAGISLAPVFGGPAYIFRNEFVNMEHSTYKMNRSPSGLYIVHNTSIQSGNGMSSPAGWQNSFIMNNLLFAGRYCFEEFDLVESAEEEWDFNGYYSTRAGTLGAPWFKWDNIRYEMLTELSAATNIEHNGVKVTLSDLVNVGLPSDPYQEEITINYDLNLSEQSAAIDTGIYLENINLPFVLDGKPDLGALELGFMPIWGHDFNNLCNHQNISVLTWTGAVSNSWSDRKNWSPCGIPNENTALIIPDGLIRYPHLEGKILIKKLNAGGM